MEDWATVLIATGPAAVTGALGYFGARLNARSTLRQAEVALDQLTVQHGEDHLRHRQGVYHQLLDHLRKFDAMLVVPGRVPSDDQFEQWLATYDHLANAAVLFGSAAVRAREEELNDLIASLADLEETVGDPRKAYEGIRDDYQARFSALVDAMREDVASPAK